MYTNVFRFTQQISSKDGKLLNEVNNITYNVNLGPDTLFLFGKHTWVFL